MHQLDIWKGKFGDDYTDRNVVNWGERWLAFEHLLYGLDIKTVLEVGCNRGHNLVTLQMLDYSVTGTEPNEKAREIAQQEGLIVSSEDICHLLFVDESFDLVFTCGVLIHISPEDLPTAVSEIYRVSKRYIIAIEYFAREEMMIPYRGYDDLLWKRDFGKIYKEHCPDLYSICTGRFEGIKSGLTYWLLEKRNGQN